VGGGRLFACEVIGLAWLGLGSVQRRGIFGLVACAFLLPPALNRLGERWILELGFVVGFARSESFLLTGPRELVLLGLFFECS